MHSFYRGPLLKPCFVRDGKYVLTTGQATFGRVVV